jgi:hypothetical protein
VALRAYAAVLERHLAGAGGEPWLVVLPHPQDAHPTHRETTQRALDVLGELAPRAGGIRLLLYRAPWSGDANTYFLAPDPASAAVPAGAGVTPELLAGIAASQEALAILVGELAATRFGLSSPAADAMGGRYAESFHRSLVQG